MWPDRVSNPGPLTYESDALPTALCGLAKFYMRIYIHKYNRNTQELGHMICILRLTDFILKMMNGWMICDFMSFLIVLQSYQDDGRVIMKGCVQWNPFTVEKISPQGGAGTRDT